MNAMMPGLPAADAVPLIPESAPFSPTQRAWLNGFLAGIYGGQAAGGASNLSIGAAPAAEPEDMPWHDPALDMPERLQLAEGRPRARKLMAAMAQLDCGQCGYLCQTYAEALADGRETSAGLCVPGGKPTTKALKAMLLEAPAPVAAPPPVAAAPAGQPVRVLECARLSGEASAKDVRHVRISLAESGLRYLPGDSLGLLPENDPALVDAIIAALGVAPDETVTLADGPAPLRDSLLRRLDIARPMDRTLELLAGAATDPDEAKALLRLQDGDDGAEPDGADLLDLLEAFPSARPLVADLARSLPSLKPRLYSIASAPDAVPGEVHLCVSVVRTARRGRVRHGVASAFLADHAVSGGPVLATITPSHFRLPAEPQTGIIMVGPGTGIAPFRAFLQARQVAGSRSPAWLFFGDQHESCDYLYRDQLEAWQAEGTLTRLSLAFSRDQSEKIYVQDRMREAATDLWHWLQGGAHFYVCGDASRMARDVDQALRDVAQREGGLSEDQARDWIVALARQGRYLRDVY